MTAKEIREMSGLKRVDFCKKYDIPIRTMENWEAETTKAPKYVLDLLERAVMEDFMSQQNIGHWIEHDCKSLREMGYYRCSECNHGYQRYDRKYELHKIDNFCPNCGAKMSESEDK